MILRYGTYSHALHEAAIAVHKEPLRNKGGLLYGWSETWTITGFLQADTPQGLATACNALELAYAVGQQKISLLLDDGTTTVRFMAGLSPLGGTDVVGGVSFPEDGRASAEFSTFRNYSIQVCGRYPFLGKGAAVLLSWMETLSFTGGGPRFVHLQPLNGPPQKQYVATSTPFRASQQGTALGLYGYPIPPGPIWPVAEQQDRRHIAYKTPTRSGGVTPIYTDFPVEWSYSFEDAGPLNGLPTFWK